MPDKWRFLVSVGLITAVSTLAFADALSGLHSTWPDAHINVTLAHSATQVDQGEPLSVHVESDQEAHLLFLFVDAEGRARLMAPRRENDEDRIYPGGSGLDFPDATAGETLFARLPPGPATLYVLASNERLLPVKANDDTTGMPAKELLQRIDSARSANPGLHLAVTALPLQVARPQPKEFVSAEEFVQFYGIATRGVKKVERAFPIQFETNSAELTAWGKQQLDAIGNGMKDSRLVPDQFSIEGHTDDTGTDAYNLDLSKRRAGSVARYLSRVGVADARLNQSGVGKADPAVPGKSDEARKANRRVVIKRLDASP
jgi:outer membrane protein OmpA-like peptidoglycan-associated protein